MKVMELYKMKDVVFLLLIAVTKSHAAFNDQPTANVTLGLRLSQSLENDLRVLPLSSKIKDRIRQKLLAAESVIQKRVRAVPT